MAQALGNMADAEKYMARSNNCEFRATGPCPCLIHIAFGQNSLGYEY